jgi:hypothetical protein
MKFSGDYDVVFLIAFAQPQSPSMAVVVQLTGRCCCSDEWHVCLPSEPEAIENAKFTIGG